MRTKMHKQLAIDLAKVYNFTAYETECFVKGAIFPDNCILTRIPLHKYKNYKDFILYLFNNLNKKDKNYFFKLGLITHYLADFYTAPHNVSYTINKHIKYEDVLWNLYKNKKICTKEYQPKKINFELNLDLIHLKYMKEKKTPRVDFEYITNELSKLMFTQFEQPICFYFV